MTQTIINVPAASAFDPSDITIDDNTSAAFLVQDSSQEFIRVDTTTGARKIDLETGAGNQYFIINEGGGQYVQLRNGANNQFYMSGGSTTQAMIQFFSHEQYGGGYFRSRNSSGAEIFRLDEDSNATFTLDSGNSAVFKVQDDAGSPTEFLKIDSNTAASLIEFNVPANQGAGMTVNLPEDSGSNTGFQLLVPSSAGHLKFGRQASGIYTGGTGFDLNVGGGKSFIFNGGQVRMRTSSTPIEFNLDAAGGSVQITDAADAEIFKVEEDSSLTHTLDGASGAVFKVVDDNASPNTYLKAVEAGSISTERNFEIYNSTAPAASVTDGCILFCEDVSSSSELKVRDEAGNVTTLSPHNFSLIPEGASEEMAWSYYSEKDGKKINVDMLRLARLVEQISGEKIIFEEG